MKEKRIYRFVAVLAALLAAGIGYAAVVILHFKLWIGSAAIASSYPYFFGLVLGIPTFGGAPFEIHFYNQAIWGLWAAFAYAVTLRILLGKLQWMRLIALYIWTLALGFILGNYAISGIFDVGSAINIAFAIWFFTGLFIVRDWVVRP